MSRAETIESVGETGGMRNSTFSQHTCCMELPRPFQTWPGLLTTTTITTGSGAGSDPMHLHHNRHNLHSLQAVYLSYPLSYLQQEDQDEHQTNQQLPTLAPSPRAPLLPLCNRMDERGEGFSEERCGSDRVAHQEAYSRQGPLPDLLPQNEHLSWGSPHHRASRVVGLQELEVRRVANQLRAVGDEFNATVLRRVHAVPHWHDWRDACRGLLNFITQTLSTLFRLT